MHDVLQRICSESADLAAFLAANNQPSLLSNAEDDARKILVLSAASLFEHRITLSLLAYSDRVSTSDKLVNALIRNKAIKRQYHTYFDWENRKAGPFFTLLGEDIGIQLKNSCKEGVGKQQLDSFLEIGYMRNCLVHQNFAEFAIDISAEEVRKHCEYADKFVESVELLLSAPAA